MKDKDDNQKFLEKFKDQITTMGKNGILDTNNNHNIKSNINNNINSKGRKGSAFLKPINKAKPKNNNDNNNNLITEPLKNNLVNNNDKVINENNNINTNNPYIINNNTNNNNNISPILYYKYQNPYMYYNYNTNLYMNNNIQPNNIYPPYQLYYFPNNNQNLLNPYLIQNNYPNTENNKKSNNPPNKKKLRPISAQNISNNNRSYLTNNNNITNLTINNNSNMTNINRYEYKPYTLKDYKEIMNVDTLGGLGANIGTEEWNKKKEKMDKMSEYSKNIFRKTKTIKNKGNINNKKKEEISTRKRANEYSKLIRPKSSGHFHVNVVKRNNYGINNKLNVINNENIIQGKMALINAKKLKEKNNNINKNENNNIDKMKDIFDENQDETNDDKEMMEYYNKFKINENEFLGEDNNNDKNKANSNNEDSLEIKKEEINNSNITTIKKFRTFKEQRNAANNKNNNINNIINKDNDINEEFNYNEEKEKEVNIESLFSEREKYLKEIENIKKGLQQK